jgi:iron complex transport system ATP-binding protein
VVFSTHRPDHAYAVADLTLLMLGDREFCCGPAHTAMTEERLHLLYGIEMKRLSFQHNGKTVETFIPIYDSNNVSNRCSE